MQTKISWILALVLAVCLGGSLIALVQQKAARKDAEEAANRALTAKREGEDAVAKALAAREAAEGANLKVEAARKQLDEELVATRAALSLTKQQAAELQIQAPRLEAELAATRKVLAESQRANPNGVAPKEEPRTIAAPVAVPRRAPGGWSVPEMLPADTLGLITVRDVPTITAKGKETGLYKILTHPDVERVFRKQMGQARGAIFAGEVMLGEKLSTLIDYVSQGEITFALLGVDKRLPDGKPLPDLMLSIELRDKAPQFLEEFNKRLDQLKALTNGNLQYTQTPLGNTTVTRFKYPDFPGELSCGMCDGIFLMCLGEGRIEKLLAMHQKMKNAQAKAPLGEGIAPEVLAQLPSFKKAVEKAGADADVIAFVNIEAIVKNPIINDPNKEITATQRHELEMSGLRDVKAFSYSAGVKDAGVRETVFFDVPAAQRKGVLGLIDGEGADLNAFYAAPRNSVLAWTFKVNLEQLLEKGVALAEIENPQARENVAAGLLFIGQQLNLDPKKDLLGSLTGQGVFSLAVPYKNAKLALAMPQPVLALRIKDQEGIKRLTKALVGAAQEKFEFIETADNGKTIVIARERERPADGIHQFCFVVDGDDLLLSVYPLALREELKRRAGKGGRLEDDPEFNLARANMTGQPQAMVYLDTAALAVAAYDVLIPIAQLQNKDPQVDLNALPTGELLNQNLGSALIDLHFAADGIMLEGYSPGGVFSLLIPAAAGAKFAQMRNAAQNNFDGPAPQVIAVKPRNKTDQAKVEALTKLARDLKEYAVEHGGNFPAKLDEMRPKYLQDLGKEIEQIVYLGKQAADNRIVAHSSDKLQGNIAILTQGGTIQSILRSMLGKVLREGYLEPNQAVKPPRPPEF